MSLYHEYRFWCPTRGSHAARISAVGGTEAARIHGEQARCAEYYALISAEVNGKVYRERRERALDAIEEAIMRGDTPGEVVFDERT